MRECPIGSPRATRRLPRVEPSCSAARRRFRGFSSAGPPTSGLARPDAEKNSGSGGARSMMGHTWSAFPHVPCPGQQPRSDSAKRLAAHRVQRVAWGHIVPDGRREFASDAACRPARRHCVRHPRPPLDRFGTMVDPPIGRRAPVSRSAHRNQLSQRTEGWPSRNHAQRGGGIRFSNSHAGANPPSQLPASTVRALARSARSPVDTNACPSRAQASRPPG